MSHVSFYMETASCHCQVPVPKLPIGITSAESFGCAPTIAVIHHPQCQFQKKQKDSNTIERSLKRVHTHTPYRIIKNVVAASNSHAQPIPAGNSLGTSAGAQHRGIEMLGVLPPPNKGLQPVDRRKSPLLSNLQSPSFGVP